MSGAIVYIRPSLSDHEPRGIHQYPHDEAFHGGQFESSRSQGEDAARVIFAEVVTRLGEQISDVAHLPHVEFAPRLFAAIVKRWQRAVLANNEVILSSASTAGTGPDSDGGLRL